MFLYELICLRLLNLTIYSVQPVDIFIYPRRSYPKLQARS